jgi:hypothetical protein
MFMVWWLAKMYFIGSILDLKLSEQAALLMSLVVALESTNASFRIPSNSLFTQS